MLSSKKFSPSLTFSFDTLVGLDSRSDFINLPSSAVFGEAISHTIRITTKKITAHRQANHSHDTNDTGNKAKQNSHRKNTAFTENNNTTENL